MKLKQKFMATLLTVIMLMGYVSTLENAVIAAGVNLSGQNGKTNHANVEFNSYFEGGEHSKTFEMDKEAKLYLNIKVSNKGYLKNGIVQFSNANFEIDINNLKNDSVQSISKNEIKLKQINNSSNETIIEVPIVILTGETVDSNLFAKTTTISFTGTYIDENGKEKDIKKEINNEVKWKGTAEIDLAGEVSKYMPFEKGEEKGVFIQARVKSGLKENSLPVLSTKLEVTIPEIKLLGENSITPARITVVSSTTAGTNGKDSNTFSEENYKYNETAGKVEIQVENPEENGKISWKKNAADEYLVNYVYTGEEVYNYVKEQLSKEEAITGEIAVKATIEAYNSEQTKLEKAGKIAYNIREEKGNLIEPSISSTSEISKGYIYANYAKTQKETNKQSIEAKKDTEYAVNYTAPVYDKNLIDTVEFETLAEKYIDNDEKEYSIKSGDIYSKTVKISEVVFNKMLGEEGRIEISNKSGEKLAEITKETEKDIVGNYIVNIGEAKTNEIIIKTSKPITEGHIAITVEKAILAEQSYVKEDMEKFSKITLGVILEKQTAQTEMKLTEPVSKAEISIGTENLSTVVENKDVELRVVLDTSSNKNALYKNPVLQIVLPENIEKLNMKSVDLLLEDEIKIKETKVEEQNDRKVILITLEGTQTKYMDNGSTTTQKNVISKGANIVIKADITFKKLAPSASTNILLYYTNENSNLYEKTNQQNKARATKAATATQIMGLATTGIEIVSPNGVVTENHMSGFSSNGNISNSTTEKQEQTIDTNTTAKEVTTGGTIVNNYANSIENVFVLGRIPYSGNKQIDGIEQLGSNFTMKMKNKISMTGIDNSKVKIYYSTNGEATKDLINTQNGWTETPTNLDEVKSYLIVISGEVATGAQFSFNYKAELPANLSYNNSSYTTYKVYYDNKMQGATLGETKVAGTIGLSTGAAPDISIELKSTSDTVREGQIVKMKATIKNSGSRIVKNIKVNVPVPENATFMEYVTGNGFYEEDVKTKVLTVGELEAGKSKQVSYYIRFNDNVVTEETENTAHNEATANTYPKAITHKVTLTADDITGNISSNEYKFNVQEGKIAISIHTETSEKQVLKKGEVLAYTINLTNIGTTEELTNTIVTIPLPEGTKYKNAEIKDSWDSTNSTTDGITYDENNNTVTINIGTLKIQKMILLNVEVKEFEGSIAIMAKAKADGTEEHYSNITEYMSEIVDLEVSELTTSSKYVKEGDTVTYTLKITNKGDSTITGIRISDAIPEGLTFVKATYTYGGKEQTVTTLKNGKVEISINQLAAGESSTIKVIAKAGILPDKNDKEVKNNMSVVANNYANTTTNTVTNIIEYYQTIHEQSGNDNETTTPTPTPSVDHYKITGTAWLDTNKNGKREESEELLSGIEVMLVNKSNSQLVTDVDTGEKKIVTTNANGQYEFSNLEAGEYLVIFLYDAGKYSVTEYQANEVEVGYNSDAINMKITLDGEQRYAGVTDTIKVTDANVRDMDIGLYLAEKFDLKLDKYISKVTVTTPSSGTKTYNYNNAKLTKREIYGKDVNNSNMIIEYKIVVTNEGQIAGYAKKIIDYLPEGIKFSTELNKDWYISDNNGAVYNTSLANEKIEPGQSKEVTLVLSLSLTDKTVGTIINNNAEIYESYNDQGIQDYDSQEANKLESEDDMSNADIMISLATGNIIIYTTFALAIIMLLGFGIFEIKRRVLDKKDN